MKILGAIDWARTDKNGKRVAWVRPVVDCTGDQWRSVDPSEFPTRGKAIWFEAPDVPDETLLFFRPEPAESGHHEPGQTEAPYSDFFKVVDWTWAVEVVDLRHVGDADDVRRALTTGLALPWTPPRPALLRCSDGFIGPVRIAHRQGASFLEKTAHNQFPYHPQLDVREIPDGRSARLVVPTTSVPPGTGQVDWDDDWLVLKRALEFAVRRAQSAGVDVAWTKRQLEDAAESLATGGDIAKLGLERSRLSRALGIVSHLLPADDQAKQLVAELSSHPLVEEKLRAAVDEARQAGRDEIQRELARELQELERLRKERQAVADELTAERKKLEGLRAGREAEISAIERAIDERVSEVLRKPETLLADAAILRAVMRSDERPASTSLHPQFRSRTVEGWRFGGQRLTDLMDLRKRLARSLKAHGVSGRVGTVLHGAFCARLVPLLAGAQSLAALKAYAHVAAGDRIVVVHASASLLEPGDLFGRVDPSGRFLPQASGLVDEIARARASEGLLLVVIEGVNRGPTESFFLPVVRAAMSGTPIPVFHHLAVSDRDPYRNEARVEWPSNVLLAGTVVDGPTTLPVAAEVWSDAVLVQCDRVDPDEAPPDVSELSRQLFQIGVTSAAEDFDVPEIPELPGLSGAVGHCPGRLAAALKGVMDSTKAKVEVVCAALVPLLATLADEELRQGVVDRLAPSLGMAPEELGRHVERARRYVA